MTSHEPASRELHPSLSPEERQELFWRGVRLFNSRRFYDCHDAFETIWRSTTPEPRDLFQGLIQVAVGFYHYLERGKPHVALRVLNKGRRRLEPLAPVCHGIDLADLLDHVEGWRRWLEDPEGPRPAPPRLRVNNEGLSGPSTPPCAC
jgi:hypothetical protein